MNSTLVCLSKQVMCKDEQSTALDVEIADSIDACKRLREPWLELSRRTNALPPNVNPDRFLATLQAMGPKVNPYIVIFRNAGVPRAMIVARKSGGRSISQLGYLRIPSPSVKSLDIVYGGLLASDEAGARSVANHIAMLLTKRIVDRVLVNHLAMNSLPYREIACHADITRALRIERTEPHWVIKPDSADPEFGLSSLSSRTRRTLRRERRKIEKTLGSVHVDLLGRRRDVDRIIDWAAQITSVTFHDKLGNPFRDAAIWRYPLELEADRDALCAVFMLAQTQPIAFFIGSLHANTLFLDATGYLPQHAAYSPGKHLLLWLIRHCAAERIETIDLGFGDAEYKRVFGTHHWAEQSIRLYGRSVRGMAAWITNAMTTRGATRLQATANRLGIARRIKNAWRWSMTRVHS